MRQEISCDDDGMDVARYMSRVSLSREVHEDPYWIDEAEGVLNSEKAQPRRKVVDRLGEG